MEEANSQVEHWTDQFPSFPLMRFYVGLLQHSAQPYIGSDWKRTADARRWYEKTVDSITMESESRVKAG
jgi:hypothetical protein